MGVCKDRQVGINTAGTMPLLLMFGHVTTQHPYCTAANDGVKTTPPRISLILSTVNKFIVRGTAAPGKYDT